VLSKVAHLATHSLRYLETGSGPTTVFLHAFPLGAEQWLPQLLKPAGSGRFVAPDLRGFGGGDPGVAPGGISIDTYAADVIELMAHLEIPNARLVGSSMGGYVALAILRRAPRRVRSLVLADTRASADSADARAGREAMLRTIETHGVATVASQMIPRLLGEATRRSQPDLADAIERLILPNTPDGIATAVRAMRDRPDATPLLSTITCPTTVIVGREDVVTPLAECEALSVSIPNARFVVIDDAGHLPNIEQPAAFAAALTATS
jgi:3-oxoadipate enol-lactonase